MEMLWLKRALFNKPTLLLQLLYKTTCLMGNIHVFVLFILLQYLVKDILTVCCSMRSAFRLKDGHFRYAMGGTYPRMHLRNSTSPWPPGSEK